MRHLHATRNNYVTNAHAQLYTLTVAAGKSTFLKILGESNPGYHIVSEPLSKWLNVPTDDEVSKIIIGDKNIIFQLMVVMK